MLEPFLSTDCRAKTCFWSKIFQSNLLSNKTNYYNSCKLTREPTESGMIPLNSLLDNHLANGKWVSGLCSSFFWENLKILQIQQIDKRTNRIWNSAAQLVVG